MIKMFIMHQKADVEYYRKHHLPLVEKIPGIAHLTMNVGVPRPDGTLAPFQIVTELQFNSESDLKWMLSSQELQEALADVPNFNPDPTSVVRVVTQEELAW